jgi:murein DD-endopeptidase MepM/ murein hydrolase activator NlpD
VLTPDRAFNLLIKGTTEERDYTVVRGDTAWNIAKRFSMSVADMEKANPQKNIERLYVGDILNLIVPTPLVRVEAHYVHTTSRLIPYETIVRWDNTLYRTKSIVERSGSTGKKRIKTRVSMRNGTPIDTEVLSETITRHPVVEIVRRGTLRTPDDWLTAAFLPKELGIITSPFGKRWGRFHRGIDVGVPPGTPVYAIRSGRVLYASFDKRLGYFVLIQHTGGLESLYGHNSELLVRRGDAVRKGQTIARSGNSGYSTGPHVHFEVRKSGRLLDPILFLRSHYEDAMISEAW